ncbi:hypothetical protein LTR78_003733 [Recurvomyces mirabilis]|uniref:Ras modification protein ERF4 n=1 Tax=Recurvomyces mirabilis TaxID=574656 RepID=A0AAE0WRF5_9PEZI|nr:hypothetical protein LTR78_003733 [Recurvomyces mirabilis]KAK5154845.1 hypothetical protein LTS14_006426 [Recurvomyces mirabilis]
METLHKLAGVQDASDLQSSWNERPSQPQVVPPPVPAKDDHYGESSQRDTFQRASRASLPLNRRASHKSFNSSRSRGAKSRPHSPVGAPEDYPAPPSATQKEFGGGVGTSSSSAQDEPDHQTAIPASRPSHDSIATATTGTEDFAWGPWHPCFPHPNPHCSPNSPEYLNTRVIRVKRDWLQSGDLYPQYANLYPEILDPLVSDSDFRYLVSNLNSRLKAAFDPFASRSWVDTVMGVLTGWVWDDLGLTGAKRAEKGIEGFLEEWNRGCEREGKEVRVIGLRRTGFMGLDFVIPDPGIDGVDEEDDVLEDEIMG